ncbi:MAG: potassium-transporting ATPase subunit KdpB [Candidatus Thermoplasmatota archaeon]|jgi:K+-transporting ATPase ATPase B chain|nr:potassium-transporting ATPase subunit KdpB [Candidatus Thermoplasmatota archaeon]MCL5963559.1 potassium-transporting ATPase subunit KdpB [Candidatus Thermoplasmatota archaeon]
MDNRKKGLSHLHGNLKTIIKLAFVESVVKFDPRKLWKNPVMFVIFIYTLYVFFVTLDPYLFRDVVNISNFSRIYYIEITIILFATIWFANLAEAIAEAQGRAQADSLRSMKSEIVATLYDPKTSTEKKIFSKDLKYNDVIIVRENEPIPKDGEIIDGSALIDESMITGESQAVMKESGGDKTSVTGATIVRSGTIKVRVTEKPGESFLDRMIALVESSKRQKTPNEIALNVVLAILTFIMVFVILTLVYIEIALSIEIDIATMVALLVCLAPTTIGGLLSAIGIAGITRVAKVNVIAKSGKAVEAAGDVDVLILDKTGTITVGNRIATEFVPTKNYKMEDLLYNVVIASIYDTTPEGKSIIKIAYKRGIKVDTKNMGELQKIPFSPQTRYSGIIMPDGTRIIKGSVDAIEKETGYIPADLHMKSKEVADQGATPLLISRNKEVIGLIVMKDVIKPGIRERLRELKVMGIKTVMCTGDNRLTARFIAKDSGVDEYIAEAKPEDKLTVTKKYQAKGMLTAMTGDGTNDSPALSQADVGLAMNSGTPAAKEAANMVDLDSDPTKLIEVVAIGKQLLITRGALTTFSITNDVAKYFAILPAMFFMIANLTSLNVMHLASPQSAILSAVIFNAITIPILIPFAIKGISYTPASATQLLRQNVIFFGFGGVLTAFIGIKIIDIIITTGSVGHVIAISYYILKVMLALIGVKI